jgi:hypothetical protein
MRGNRFALSNGPRLILGIFGLPAGSLASRLDFLQPLGSVERVSCVEGIVEVNVHFVHFMVEWCFYWGIVTPAKLRWAERYIFLCRWMITSMKRYSVIG